MARKKEKEPEQKEEQMADHLKLKPKVCPRPECESTNVKWRYFNNRKLDQPRYQCKDCTKLFTRGGTTRGSYITLKKIIKRVEETQSDDEDGVEKRNGGRKRTLPLLNKNTRYRAAKKRRAVSSSEDDEDEEEMPESDPEDGNDEAQNPDTEEDEDDDYEGEDGEGGEGGEGGDDEDEDYEEDDENDAEDDDDEDDEEDGDDEDGEGEGGDDEEDEQDEDHEVDEDGSGRVRAQRLPSTINGRSNTADENSLQSCSEEDEADAIESSSEDEVDTPWIPDEEESAAHEPAEENGQREDEVDEGHHMEFAEGDAMLISYLMENQADDVKEGIYDSCVSDGGRGKAPCDEDHMETGSGSGALKKKAVKLLHVDEKVHHEENNMLLDFIRPEQYKHLGRVQENMSEADDCEFFSVYFQHLRDEIKAYTDYRSTLSQTDGERDVGTPTKIELKENAMKYLDDALHAAERVYFEEYFILLDVKCKVQMYERIRGNRQIMYEVEKSFQNLRNDLKGVIHEWDDTSTFTSNKLQLIDELKDELVEVVENVESFKEQVMDINIGRVSHFIMVKIEKEARKIADAVLDVVRRVD